VRNGPCQEPGYHFVLVFMFHWFWAKFSYQQNHEYCGLSSLIFSWTGLGNFKIFFLLSVLNTVYVKFTSGCSTHFFLPILCFFSFHHILLWNITNIFHLYIPIINNAFIFLFCTHGRKMKGKKRVTCLLLNTLQGMEY
jgi:hypothetical protein